MQLPNIIAIIVAALFCFAPLMKGNANKRSEGDGRIALYSYHLDEFVEVTYKDDAGYKEDAIEMIENVFRSRDGKKHEIDIKLIELLDQIQDHFSADAVEIISGYRSNAFNNMLRANGRGAASESLHTKGLAADIHIDEVTEENLYDYAKSLNRGGAGFYPRYAFVHVDTGPVRTWSESPPTQRVLVGMDNNPNNTWSAITNKNIYKRGESLKLSLKSEGADNMNLIIESIFLERFNRGKWSERIKVDAQIKDKLEFSLILPKDQAYGKYRLVISPNKSSKGPAVYSNEFYVKKIGFKD